MHSSPRALFLAAAVSAGLLSMTAPCAAQTASGLDTPTGVAQMPFAIGGTEIMRMTATGLGIRVTPAYTFDVSGTARITGATGIGTTPSASYILNVSGNSNFAGNITVSGTGTYTGYVYAGGYFHNSDARLKKNVRSLKGLEIVEKLNGVSFEWKKDGTTSAGVLAQDVEKVMPTAVRTNGEGFKAVDYDQLAGPMIEAIKELKAQNDILAAEVAALKKTVGTRATIEQ